MATNYDPRKVAVLANGIEIVGFAEGTFIEAERSVARWEPHVGAKGEVTMVRSANDTGTIKLTLKHNSPSNAYLSQLWKLQDLPGAEISIVVSDRNFIADVSASGSDAKIANLPAFARGDEVEDAEWEFVVADYTQATEGII